MQHVRCDRYDWPVGSEPRPEARSPKPEARGSCLPTCPRDAPPCRWSRTRPSRTAQSASTIVLGWPAGRVAEAHWQVGTRTGPRHDLRVAQPTHPSEQLARLTEANHPQTSVQQHHAPLSNFSCADCGASGGCDSGELLIHELGLWYMGWGLVGYTRSPVQYARLLREPQQKRDELGSALQLPLRRPM